MKSQPKDFTINPKNMKKNLLKISSVLLILLLSGIGVFYLKNFDKPPADQENILSPDPGGTPDESLNPPQPSEIKLTDHNTYISFSDKLTFDVGEMIAEAASVPEVLVIDDDIYVYFVNAYAAHQGDGVNIYYIVSTDDGVSWTEREPIKIDGLVAGMEPVDPSLLDLGDGRYRLYFYDFGKSGPNQQITKNIYSAISEDGINFVLEEGVRLSMKENMTDPEVVYYKDTWFMYYAGGDVDGISVASSSDGLTFVDHGSVNDSEFMGIPGAFVEKNRIYLYDCKVVAESTDGIHFEKVSDFATRGCDPSPSIYKDGYIMIYKDFSQSNSSPKSPQT